MRIRSIKPEFWRSQDISKLSIEDRLLFVGLWSYVDDNGVGQDRVPMVAADLFADDLAENPRETLARVSRGLSNLFTAGRIARYSADGRDYFEIVNWSLHQRIDKPNKPRYPQSTSDDAEPRETLATSSRNPRETLAPGTEEQRNRGTREQTSSSGIADAISRPDDRPEIFAILDHLDQAIEGNGAKKPARTKRNLDAVRLMLDKDGRTAEQITAAIDYATSDEFWRGNILSASKLRDKYDQLRLNAQRDKWKRPGTKRQQQDAEFWEIEMAAARAADESSIERREIAS